MKKQVLTGMTMLGLFLTLAVASVHAQSKTKIEATIPFDFTVGETKLRFGRYTVTTRNEVVLMIQSEGAKSTVLRLTNAIYSVAASAKSKLVFHRYGQYYFLSEVWAGGGRSGRKLLKSRQERAIEKQVAFVRSKSELAQVKFDRVEILATAR